MAEMMKKFGKYFLLDQLAQGGMAEIYRARMATPDGGGRLLAIKRIIQSYSSNVEFVTMFKSEIKTTSGFTHPNIVQLYDYGEEQSMLYIAMEYVDGRNLRQFISRFGELKSAFPIEAAVYIIEQAAHGMAYAHGYKDKFSGKSLNIVHRDISPQNILISYDGAVKVIDFGIAKAVTNSEATRAGVIKGKPSYLSPEQIVGDVLDGRSDIFALGIVLWELLAGRKLFAADNDFSVLKLIENCANHVKPPSTYNPKIPKELDSIVMRCLQNNRDQRYANSEELQRALHKFLYQFAPEFNPADLAYYARDLFKNEIVEDRKKLLKLNEKAEQLLTALEQQEAAKKTGGSSSSKEEPTLAMASGEQTETDMSLQNIPVQKPNERSGSFRMVDFSGKDKEKTDIKLDVPGGGMSSSARPNTGGTGIGTRTGGGFTPAANSTKFIQRTSRTGSTVTGMAYQGESSSRVPRVAALLLILAAAAGFWYYNENGGSLTGPSPASQGAATLTIQGNVKAATVFVNGEQVGSSLPVTVQKVSAGKPVRVVVSSNGYKKFAQSVQVRPGENASVTAHLEREDSATAVSVPSGHTPPGSSEARTLTLRLNVIPAGIGTRMRLNGQAVDVSGLVTAPLDTPLNLIVERDGFRTYRDTVTLDSSRLGGALEHTINVTLEAARFGYVSIKTTPSADVMIKIDGIEEKWATPVSRRRIPVGTYKARLVNTLLGMEKEVTFSVGEDRFTNIEERLTVSADGGRLPGSSH